MTDATPIHISPDLSMPLEAVTETFGILAKRGVGKTSTAVVLVEEMIAAGQQPVVVDPVGVWWGLRSSADGKGPGLPVVILGGEHADVPLDPGSGELVADLVYEGGFPAVLDLGSWTKGQQARFVAAFAERLYQICKRPLHLVLDEADAFVPQQVQPEQARMVGAIDVLVRRGRARGLGCTLITQRSAVVNKNVLSQVETLIALRTIAPQDVKVLEDWLKHHDSAAKRDEMLGTIATLPIGTAWVWSPGWLEVFKRVAVRRRRTFDSSATPKVGEHRLVPKVIAPVDVDAVRTKLAATIEKAEQEDPVRLRKRIDQLERQLVAAHEAAAIPAAVPDPERIEIPVLTEEDRQTVEAIFARLDAWKIGIGDELASLVRAIADAVGKAQPLAFAPMSVDFRKPFEPRRLTATDLDVRDPPAKQARAASSGDLTGPQRKILVAIAECRALALYPADKVQVGLMAGYTNIRSGGFSEPFAELVAAGLVTSTSGSVELTADGAARVGDVAPPRTPREMHERVCTVLPGPEQKLLRTMLSWFPKPASKEQIGEACGYTNIRSGGFSEPFARLVALKLVQKESGGFVAAPALFLRRAR